MKKNKNKAPKVEHKHNLHVMLSDNDSRMMVDTIENGGFISGKNRKTYSQFIRYCIRHINDTKEINLSEKDHKKIDSLVDAIAANRKPIDEGLSDVKRMLDDFHPVAVNLNQAVKQINTLMYLLREGKIDLENCAKKMEAVVDWLYDILGDYGDEKGIHFGLESYLQKAEGMLEQIRSKMEGVLDREDKILERLII